MRPPSPHSKFFSSLKQVEKRLKLETPTHSFNSSPAPAHHTLTESLGTPMFIHAELEPNSHSSNAFQESSEPPMAFLSSSPQSPPIHQTLAQDDKLNTIAIEDKISGINEIDALMQLLGLSNSERGEEKRVSDECCDCESGFFEKIVGAKGTKSRKERKRLDGWIRHFSQSNERTETLSLGYLLLGKAACELENGDGHECGGLDFPSAIEEYLKNDPPTD